LLDYNTTYYWRVDEDDDDDYQNGAISEGYVWSFTTESAPAPTWEVEVSPDAIDFGDVEIGSSVRLISTITNTGTGEPIDFNVQMTPGSSADSSITGVTTYSLGAGLWADVTVAFTPSSQGLATGTLQFTWTGGHGSGGTEEVSLSGVGVTYEPPPGEQIAAILDFIDESVAAGTLVGEGPGKSAENRLNALRNMIEAASDLIEDRLYEDAYQQLEDALKKCDGQTPPPDFVSGPAAARLAEMINNLMAAL
jgi:hypothetical protein